MFSPNVPEIGLSGSSVTPGASAARSVGNSIRGIADESAGLKKNGTDSRSVPGGED